MSVHCDLARRAPAWCARAGRPSASSSRRAVGLQDRAMRAEPGGVPAARGEGPHAGHLVAALAFDGLDLRAGTPGQHGARIVAEDRLRHRQIEIGRRHGAAAGLAQAPGGRGVGARDGLDDVEEGDRDRSRSRSTSAASAGGTAAPRAACRAGAGGSRRLSSISSDAAATTGRTRLGARDHGRVAGKIGGSRDQRVQGHPL